MVHTRGEFSPDRRSTKKKKKKSQVQLGSIFETIIEDVFLFHFKKKHQSDWLDRITFDTLDVSIHMNTTCDLTTIFSLWKERVLKSATQFGPLNLIWPPLWLLQQLKVHVKLGLPGQKLLNTF